MKIELYPELCCDLCNEVIHNHIDCPACGGQYAATDTYHQIDTVGEVIQCEGCEARFKLVMMEGCYDEWEWETIGGKDDTGSER